jgi:hypothetical protein
MRFLHTPTLRETFVASGEYRSKRDGQPLAGVEQWAIYALPDGSHFMRFDRDWRDRDGTSVLAEALYQPAAVGRRIDRYSRRLITGSGSLRQQFDFFETSVVVGYDDADNVRQDFEAALPSGYGVILPMALLTGIGALQVAAAGGALTTFLGFADAQPEIDAVTVQVTGEAVIPVDGRDIPAREVTLTRAGDVTRSHRLWLDAAGTLLKCTAPDGVVMELHRYAHSP